MKLPCSSVAGGVCTAGDPVLAIADAKSCSTTDYDTAKTNWEVVRKEYVRLQKVAAEALTAW